MSGGRAWQQFTERSLPPSSCSQAHTNPGRAETGMFAQQSRAPLLPPPGRLEPKEHTSLGFKFGPESSFDLRGLSFPGLFICGNHPGFPLLQIHLQEVMAGGGPSEARLPPAVPLVPVPGTLPVSIRACRCDSQPWNKSPQSLEENGLRCTSGEEWLEMGSPGFESPLTWGKAPPGSVSSL